MKRFFLLILIAACAFSCKKEHASATTAETPVFYFKGLVNGISYDLEAGMNDYYMYASLDHTDTSYYRFHGKLMRTSSPYQNIEIIINDYKNSSNSSAVNPDSSLKSGFYKYISNGLDTAYQVQFNGYYSFGSVQSYYWDFGDGNSSSQANPIHVYNASGIYNVCLTINGTNGCNNTLCKTIDLSSYHNSQYKVTIASYISNDTAWFTATPSFSAVSTYTWDYGDSSYFVSTASTQHVYPQNKTYTLSVFVMDSITQNIYKGTYEAPIGSNHCAVNFTYSSSLTLISSGLMSKIIINWMDATGTLYSSNTIHGQPSSSYFQILSEEAYKNNANGQPTRKLHVRFKCVLYDSSGNSIPMQSDDSIIAVAY